VEDWLVDADFADDHYFLPLTQTLDLAGIKRLAKRLSSAKTRPQERVRGMLKSCATKVKEPDPELKKAALESLSADTDPQRFLSSISGEKGASGFQGWIFAYLTPREFVQGPLKTWLLRLNSKWRTYLLGMISNTTSTQPTHDSEFAKELRQFQLDFIISKEYPADIRRAVYDYTAYPESPELQKKYVQFSLESFRDVALKPDIDGSTLVHYLVLNLQENSKELAEVLEVGCRRGWLSSGALHERKAIRPAGIASALRALKEPELPEGVVNRLLSLVDELGTPEEKASLGSIVSSVGNDLYPEAVRIFHDGILALPDAKREEAWKNYLAVFNSAPNPIKASMAGKLVGADGSHVQELMTKASESPSSETRLVALEHWMSAPVVDPAVRTSMLAKGAEGSGGREPAGCREWADALSRPRRRAFHHRSAELPVRESG
jgi:hypothetical protein